eukprot:g19795.t1
MIARRLLLFLHLALVLAATRAETTTNFDVDPVWLRLETALDYFPPRLLKKHRIILKQSIFFTQDRGALGRYGPDHFPGLPFSGGREKETAWNRNSWQYHPFRLYLPRKDAISPAKMKYLEPLPEDSSDDAVPWVQFSSGAEVVRLLEEVCEDDEEVLAEDFNSRGPSDEIFNLAPQRVALKKLVQLVLEKRREQSQTRQSVQMMVRRWEDVMREVAFPQDILDMDVYLEERNVDHLNKQTNLYDFLPGRARLLAAKDPRTGHFSLDGANTEAKDGRNLPLSVSSPFFNTANEKGEPRPRDVFYPAFYDSLIDLVFDYFGSDRGLFCGLMPRPGIIASCGNNYGRLYEHVLKLKGKIQRRCEGRTRGGRGAGADISSPEESDTPVLRLLEIGIGSVTPQNPGGPMTWMKQFVNRNYVPGHGLRSWRAIFPRAMKRDWDHDGQRNIKTAVVNSMNKTSIERFVHSEIALARTKVGVRGTTLHAKQDLTEEQERGGNGKRKNEGKNVVSGRGGAEVFTAEQEDEVLDPTSDSKGFFDVIIDDGLHTGISVLSSFVFLYPYLKKNGLYFWEDIRPFITDLSLFSKYLFFGEPEEYQESLETHSDRLKWASSGLGAADGDLIALIRRNSEMGNEHHPYGRRAGGSGQDGQEGGRGTRSTTQQTATSSPQDGGGLPYTGDAVDALHDDLYRVGSERDWAADGSVHFVTKFRTYMDSCRMRYMMRFDYGNDTEWWEANRFSLDRPTVGWFHPKDWDHWPLQMQCFDQVHTYERCCKGNDPTDEGKADCFAYLELALTTHQYAVCCSDKSVRRFKPLVRQAAEPSSAARAAAPTSSPKLSSSKTADKHDITMKDEAPGQNVDAASRRKTNKQLDAEIRKREHEKVYGAGKTRHTRKQIVAMQREDAEKLGRTLKTGGGGDLSALPPGSSRRVLLKKPSGQKKIGEKTAALMQKCLGLGVFGR